MENETAHILVIEDEPITRAQLVSHLESAGYQVTALESASGVRSMLAEAGIDLCLVDINLPGKDGLTLTRELRQHSDVGIILVTGKDGQVDKLAGLESGADDYVTKPFDPRELISRTRNLLRRIHLEKKHQKKGNKRFFADWSLDINKRELEAPDGTTESMSAGEFNLLRTLIDHAGEVMSRDELMGEIRNREWYPDDRYIDVLVGQVRRKFKNHSPDVSFISTIHGSGYLFVPEVS